MAAAAVAPLAASPPPEVPVVTVVREFDAAFFDLDDCLYPREKKLDVQVAQFIGQFMQERLGVAAHEMMQMRTDLYVAHGTTLAGLVEKGHVIDYNEWHDYVHGRLDYDHLLGAPQDYAQLRAMLKSLSLPKFILTNADVKHATACLSKLGIDDCFDGVFCFESFLELAEHETAMRTEGQVVVCKPWPSTFKIACSRANVAPERALFLDDNARNTAGARNCGIFSVLVGVEQPSAAADVCIRSILDLPTAMPHLFVPRVGGSSRVHLTHE